jgi:hypothetical protein
MCKPGYLKRRDGLIYYVSCCTSDNCNKELTESQIQDIIDGNVAGNAGGSSSRRHGVVKILTGIFLALLSSFIFL